MRRQTKPSDYIFQISWEVCNKVGGIYTVLSTQAKVLEQIYGDNLIYIGPDLEADNELFIADDSLYRELSEQARKFGISVRFGRWNIPGNPVVALISYNNLWAQKDNIYSLMWSNFGVDSLHAYGDYDDSCLFAYQAGRLVVLACEWLRSNSKPGKAPSVVVQAHEWMSGMGLLEVKRCEPKVGTVFTTHATSMGRSITTNNKELYAYFEGYDGDQMAAELNMQSKHSVEKASALVADCLTTVSEVTDRECQQFFGRKSDVILPNGFDPSFACKGTALKAVRKRARKAVLNTYNSLAACNLTDDTLIVSTSGRNDFRCKGFDVFFSSLNRLAERDTLKRDVLAIIAVPGWKKGPRADLQERLDKKPAIKIMDCTGFSPLANPFITHDLYNYDSEGIIKAIEANNLTTSRGKAHLLFIPSYLDGHDGIINLPYYDFLTASDYCVYPSYYEPWGYTPLESVAFGIPCLTTSLSGFGQWVNSIVGHQALLSDGVAVIPRNDSNYDQCVDEIATSIEGVAMLTPQEYSKLSEAARKLSTKALWKDFIAHYINAYTLALKMTEQ